MDEWDFREAEKRDLERRLGMQERDAEIDSRFLALEERMTVVVMQVQTLENLLKKLVKLLEGASDGE
jgi:hypothetical protein